MAIEHIVFPISKLKVSVINFPNCSGHKIPNERVYPFVKTARIISRTEGTVQA